MRKNLLKYIAYSLTIVISLWSGIGYADNIVLLVLFLLPAAIFTTFVGIDIVRWITNLDNQYNLSVRIQSVPKVAPPIKVKGIPAGMSFNEYLVSLNNDSLID